MESLKRAAYIQPDCPENNCASRCNADDIASSHVHLGIPVDCRRISDAVIINASNRSPLP
eukprot:scaffold5742_cov44-Prasinocladus_malaysianus.AAC.1